MALEEIYGIRNGSANEKGSSVGEIISVTDKKQNDISDELDMTDKQLRNYKKLLTLIPELQTPNLGI